MRSNMRPEEQEAGDDEEERDAGVEARQETREVSLDRMSALEAHVGEQNGESAHCPQPVKGDEPLRGPSSLSSALVLRCQP